jgi:SAM-dependent methyltransferase
MPNETDAQRHKRERQRLLFDGIAEQYDASRQRYPAEIVDVIVATGDIGPGACVLEIGCGTGQLTTQLAGRGFNLTVIDIGPAMIARARANISDPAVRIVVSAFEEFSGGPFDLIVSATAFHWVDPEVGLVKAAQLLRPDAWLALLSTGERYPEPLATAVRDLWVRYNRTIVWAARPSWVSDLRETPLFGDVVEITHLRDLRLTEHRVVAVECTRATFLNTAKRTRQVSQQTSGVYWKEPSMST